LKGIILQINIKIIRCFEENDKEKTGEYMTSVFINDKKIIVGDEYHDKINYKIEGMRILIENLGYNMVLDNGKEISSNSVWDNLLQTIKNK
jgi:hypothetical protein